MKAIMVMFDSLNRRMLEPYGCSWVKTPQFARLAEKAVTFDCNYVGSLPCMPARRELHTGRLNFLHRGWGPVEPFDDSMPEILKKNGVYTHLVSDHQHYWEDGGATYHNRYNSWDCVRGQEGDGWKVLPELIRASHQPGGLPLQDKMHRHDEVNRQFVDCEEQMPQARTFAGGLEFLENNWQEDQWFLQIETFDPHEPFFTQETFKKLYPHEYEGIMKDWPPYYFVTEGEDAVNHMRFEYAALVSMCDHYLGMVLDFMDEHKMWEDTMLIVNTDHGYLLGEHGWWSKTVMPVYEEIARTPLFVYDPRLGMGGVHRESLTQTIDIPATLLDFFGLPLPVDMEGKPLKAVMESDEKIRDYALFGFHEGHINVTDGRYVYMMAPDSTKPFYEYTLEPNHMRGLFSTQELQDIRLQEAFSFTKGCRTMKIPAKNGMTDAANYGCRLYDLENDPLEENPLADTAKMAELANAARRLMEANDCPPEQYGRFGLKQGEDISEEELKEFLKDAWEVRIPDGLKGYRWSREAVNMYFALMRFIPEQQKGAVEDRLKGMCGESPDKTSGQDIGKEQILDLVNEIIPKENLDMVRYFTVLNSRTE